jgi:tetratricopeptide (TPR) repeat protein
MGIEIEMIRVPISWRFSMSTSHHRRRIHLGILIVIWMTLGLTPSLQAKTKEPKPKEDPKLAKQYYEEALKLGEEGKLEEAVQSLYKAIENRRNFPAAYYYLGIAFDKLTWYSLAEIWFLTAIFYDQKMVPAYYQLGLIYMTQKRYENAEGAFQACVKLDKKHSKALSHLGLVYSYLKQPDKSMEYFKMAVTADPKDKDAQYNLGFTLFEQKKYDEALKPFEEAVVIDPKFGKAYYFIGIIYKTKGDVPKAKDAFNKGCQNQYGKACSYLKAM